ncbi:MAG TPA: hypothetical protein PLL25_02565 [Flavobacteriales bacterium]|jgi:hypothetical protein|nr:hypothetical protein [Flavobacteriales bacterium]
MRTGTLLAFLIPGALAAQAPVWQWATALRGSTNVYIDEVIGSTLNGCFVSGYCYGDLYLPFDTLQANDGQGDHFVVHVDSLGVPDRVVRSTVPVASMIPTANGGLSCRYIVQGSVVVNGTTLTSAPGSSGIGMATFDSGGTQTAIGSLDNVIEGGFMIPIWCAHQEAAGMVLATFVTDSLRVDGEWLYGWGIVLVRLSDLGVVEWHTQLEATEFYFFSGLHLSTNGKSLICVSDVAGDTRIISYSTGSDPDWWTELYGRDTMEPVPMARRPDDRVLLGAAFSTSPPDGGTALVVEEYESGGQLVNSSWASEPQLWNNAIRSVHDLPDGGALVAGYQNGLLTFGPLVQNTTGPDGFVGHIGPDGQWDWVTRETLGNVFGLRAAPGLNTRIYCAGTSDTGAQFGAHTLPFPSGGMYGVVACLGDITLSTPEQHAQDIRTLRTWPNPAQDLLHLSGDAQGAVRIVDLLGRDHSTEVRWRDAYTLDVSTLRSGVYVVQRGRSRTVFIKA